MVSHTQQILNCAQKGSQKFQDIMRALLEYLGENLKRAIGQNNFSSLQNYCRENAYFYMGVGGCVCLFLVTRRWMKSRSGFSGTSGSEAQNHRKKRGPSSKRLPSKLQAKDKFFISESNEEEVCSQEPSDGLYQNEKNDSTWEGREISQKNRSRNSNKRINIIDFEEILEKEVQNFKKQEEGKVVLEDSLSDKLFNEVYGVYQQS